MHTFKRVRAFLSWEKQNNFSVECSSCSNVKLCRNLLKTFLRVRHRWWIIVCSNKRTRLLGIWVSPFYLVVSTTLINVVSGFQWKKWRLYSSLCWHNTQRSIQHTWIISCVLLPSNGQIMWLQSLDHCVWNLCLFLQQIPHRKKTHFLHWYVKVVFCYSYKFVCVSLWQVVPPGSRQPVSEGLGAVPGQLQHRAPAPNNQEKGPAKTQALQRQLNQQHTLSNSVSYVLNAALTPWKLVVI